MGILCEYTVMGYKKEWKYHGNITNNMVTFMAVPAYPLLCLPFLLAGRCEFPAGPAGFRNTHI
jgi:hypothetical protein